MPNYRTCKIHIPVSYTHLDVYKRQELHSVQIVNETYWVQKKNITKTVRLLSFVVEPGVGTSTIRTGKYRGVVWTKKWEGRTKAGSANVQGILNEGGIWELSVEYARR